MVLLRHAYDEVVPGAESVLHSSAAGRKARQKKTRKANKKKRKGKSKERPELFRSTDQHWEVLLENSIRVANQVRTSGDIPKGMKRRKVAEQTWV